jgi:5-methylcytosine-specific restriction protein B
VKPFDEIASFEEMRVLAMGDPDAAVAQLALQAHVAAHTVVRIYFGPPGTGKTLRAVQEAVRIADPGFASASDFSACFNRMNELSDRISFITFHPSLQYEDVVESIRPRLHAGNDGETPSASEDETEVEGDRDGMSRTETPTGQLAYSHYEGPLMRLARQAMIHSEHQYVLVIDEINRGDVSRILGPVISALEADKRLGAPFPVGFERQYPPDAQLDTRTFLPANLHVIGTMNSADRNVALVDYALRRRFEFIECPPEPGLLATTDDHDALDVSRMLETLNRRIAYLLDQDHRLGHGYFMGAKTNEDVITVIAERVVPLMFEYFFGSETLIPLVFGDRPGHPNNVLIVSDSSADFEQTFGLPMDEASQYGLRNSSENPVVRIDERFWDSTSSVPAPQDAAYAVAALRKIYEPSPAQSSILGANVTPGPSQLPPEVDATSAQDTIGG